MKTEDVETVICGNGQVKCAIPGYDPFDEEELQHGDDQCSLLTALTYALIEDREREERERRRALVASLPPIVRPPEPSFFSWKWFWISALAVFVVLICLKN